jgi:hypothetical protein
MEKKFNKLERFVAPFKKFALAVKRDLFNLSSNTLPLSYSASLLGLVTF